MFTTNLRVFGQILHLQWPTQTSKMGHKIDVVLYINLEKGLANGTPTSI
jgi:hypothetical protein